MTQYPTQSEIIALHRKYAPSDKAFEIVFTHCQIVEEIALQLIQKNSLNVDVVLIKAGALLHDIGTYKFVDAQGVFGGEYLRHSIEGTHMLQKAGMPENLCKIIERHTGVGISAKEIKEKVLPLPVRDYIPETLEEKLVAYADKFHSKKQKFYTFETYRTYVARFGEEKMFMFDEMRKIFGLPDLEKLAEKYNQAII